jgi:GNAT superfamily N-acetyltransferase
MDESPIVYRRLSNDEISRVGEIDRTERIDAVYAQRGTELDERAGDFSSPPWSRDGGGEYSVAYQRAECERHVAAGAVAWGAFANDRLVGIGLVTPHVRPCIAQLAFLHVSNGHRGRGVGVRLTDELERVARRAGDTEMVVSATPSANTVRFYLGRGYSPTTEPLPELVELEPDDVHMRKQL